MYAPTDDRLLFDLFEAASALRPEARPAFLDAACAGRPDLRPLVEAMLTDAVPTDVLRPELVAEEVTDGYAGRRLGPYTLHERLGEGGMGVVYRATHEALKRTVALKLVRQGQWAPAARLRRLVHEPQLMARLNHPGIAQVLDAGVTDDGLPYFAMEYVDGQPLDAYCDAHRLSVRERLRLVLDVCEAVQYAHQHLTVHRDLKPSNVLVTSDAHPKLLDFGIARLLEAADDAPATRTGEHVLTPEYASPEQVRGEPVTTASDVYALGVVLYELLAGRRPYTFDRGRPSEVERVVSEHVPPPLPAAVVEGEAARRRSTPDQLRRALRGDLDRIVQKALHKDPARRYASAQALAEDLRRYLDGLPVQAQRDTVGYRAGKFVRRHTRALGALAAVLLVVVAALAYHTLRLTQARDEARAALARSEQVTTLVVGLFEQTDPDNGRGTDLTVRQALTEGVGPLRQASVAAPPDVRAALLDAAGRIFTNLALYDDAEAVLAEALALRRSLPGDSRAEEAASLVSQARLASARNEFPRADSLLRAGLRLQRAALGPRHPAVFRTLSLLAQSENDLGRTVSSERILAALLPLQRGVHGPRHPEVARTLRDLAHLAVANRADARAADSLARQAQAILTEALGPRHPEVARTIFVRAEAADQGGDHEAYLALTRQGVDLIREAYGPAHPQYAARLGTLVNAYFIVDRLPDAVAAAREALAIYRAAYGERNRAVADAMHNLAAVLAFTGSYDEATPLFVQSRQLWAEIDGPRSGMVALSLDQEANHLWRRRRLYGRAAELLRESLAMSREQAADAANNENGVAARLRNLAWVLWEDGRPAEAVVYMRELRENRARVVGRAHSEYAFATHDLARLLNELRRFTEAEPLAREATAGFQRLGNVEQAHHAREELARSLRAQGKPVDG